MLMKERLLQDAILTTRHDIRSRSSALFGSCVFAPLQLSDIDAAISLAKRSVHPTPLPWVIETLQYHRDAKLAGLDDGRSFYKLQDAADIRGLCGLHRYIWGPPTVCWASWFIIDPAYRHTKAPGQLAIGLFRMARSHGFQRMYVETYHGESPYAQVERALPRLGFHLEALLHDYVEPGVDSAIYVYDLRLPGSILHEFSGGTHGRRTV